MKKTLSKKIGNAGGNVLTGARLVKCFVGDTNTSLEGAVKGADDNIETLQNAVLSLDAITQSLQGSVTSITQSLQTSVASILALIAAPYNATATYAVGAYCTHGTGLFKCSTAITEAEEWNAEHWTATTVMAEIAGE